jgi:hypothetical protein
VVLFDRKLDLPFNSRLGDSKVRHRRDDDETSRFLSRRAYLHKHFN